jgi:hypothetical protein
VGNRRPHTKDEDEDEDEERELYVLAGFNTKKYEIVPLHNVRIFLIITVSKLLPAQFSQIGLCNRSTMCYL